MNSIEGVIGLFKKDDIFHRLIFNNIKLQYSKALRIIPALPPFATACPDPSGRGYLFVVCNEPENFHFKKPIIKYL
jgi:hypothetical protein